MKVLLAEHNPHPFPGAKEYLYAAWWGKEIELGEPSQPSRNMRCGAHTIWPVIGPSNFVALLRRNALGSFVCEHMLGDF